jgi:hypothetical protein
MRKKINWEVVFFVVCGLAIAAALFIHYRNNL